MSKRFQRSDWTKLGLSLLGRDGPAALTIERLCDASGRTRGSFYHHFRDHAAFIDALASFWQERDTIAIVAATEKGSAQERLSSLNDLAARIDLQVDQAMRGLAPRNDRVREVLDAVDSARLKYLTQLHRQAGRTPAKALDCAKIEYAAFVGAQVLWPDMSLRQARKLANFVHRVIAAFD